jgi:hypothetical protein
MIIFRKVSFAPITVKLQGVTRFSFADCFPVKGVVEFGFRTIFFFLRPPSEIAGVGPAITVSPSS